MLHLAILRSPYAHARIVSIDTTAAQAHPKVKAVVTGADLAEKGLAWMPTLSNDVQAVLATDKVRFQGQEVAFVVAEDRYCGARCAGAHRRRVRPARPGHRRAQGARPDAAVIRTDLDGKTDNHCFDWETGDAAATEAVFAKADVVVKQEIVYPRVHPAPMETCGAVADLRPGDRQAHAVVHLAGTARAPHAVRVGRRPARAQDPGHLPRSSVAVSATRCRSTRDTCARSSDRCSLGKPVKWMEDRSENLTSTGFARDYIMVGEIAATERRQDPRDPHPNVLADHGAFNGTPRR